MSGSQQRKAVYFSNDELQLKAWAENQPGGFSTYIKKMIVADQKGELQKQIIAQALKEFLDSREAKQFLQSSLSDVLEGRLVSPPQERELPLDLDIEEANTILSLINNI